MAEGRGGPPARRRHPGGEPAAVWLRGARRAGDAARRHLPRQRGPAAQALDRGAAGTEPGGRRPLDVRRQRLVAPAAHGPPRRHARRAAARRAGGGRAGARRGPAAGGPARWRCWATRPRSRRSSPAPRSPTPARAGRASSSPRLGAQVDVVDDAAARRRRARGTRRASWWPTARRPRSRRRRWRRSPPSSRAAGRSSDGARGASRWRARPASRRRRSPRAGRRPGSPARRSPWAAAWCVDNDDPLVAGGHVVGGLRGGAQRLDAGLAGRAPGDPRRARRRRAAPSSSPSIPSSARRARAPQALLTTALTGATPGAR